MFNDPLAFLLTFTCYGTRLHGDERGSVDLEHNVFGTDFIAPSFRLEQLRRGLLKGPPLILDAAQRGAVDRAIQQHCEFRGWHLHSWNVRTNHIHIVVAALDDPARMLNQFKSYSTRALRAGELIGKRKRVWTKGGSKRWLFTREAVARACEYVICRQGADLPMI